MNKHADLMIEYAKDWAETEVPWERWECNNGWGWSSLEAHPRWLYDVEYRRKRRTISINGIEVPEPVREPLEEGQHFYLVDFFGKLSTHWIWAGDAVDFKWLKLGMIHLTQEAAEIHCKALLSFTEVVE